MPVNDTLHQMYLDNKNLFWLTIQQVYPSVKEFDLEYDITTRELSIRKHDIPRTKEVSWI